MLNYLWLIPVLPMLGFALNGVAGLGQRALTGSRPSRRFVYGIACGSVLLSFLLSVGCFWQLLGLAPAQRLVRQEVFTWIPGNIILTQGGAVAPFHINWGLQLDPLSAVMILFVTGIGLLIHIYSIGYMHEEEGFYRYFSFLNLFMFMMLTLVLADNYLLLFVGWEGVGLCSYLLIGYYLDRKSAGDAAKKAFVVNRIGDFAFLIGMLTIFSHFGSLSFVEVFEKISTSMPQPEAAWGVLSWIALLLFIGATGKSAQVPLYVWLPDAMEGPTPVSALIHAATMVTAGVYMVARSSAIYSRAPEVTLIVATIGIVTALLAATIGLFQRDIKKVLAYSTVSQLGYMFAALGAGAVAAGMFHVFTHAFFKALLFLGAGSVIYAMHHEQDMLKMGGLRRRLPVTYWTMLIASLAISGVPGLSGFFSKDEILWRLFNTGHILIWFIGVAVAGMTSFYMFRLIFLTFWGEERFGEEQAHHIHESPPNMTIPLILLAAGSILAGYLGLPAWLGPNVFERFLEPATEWAYRPHQLGHAALSVELGLTLLSVAVALAGIYLAHYFYVRRVELPARLKERYQTLYRTVFNKFYVDEIYDALVVNRCKDLGSFFSAFDLRVVDGLVNGSAAMTRVTAWLSGLADIHIVDRVVNLVGQTVRAGSRGFRRLQTGIVQSYVLFFVLGIILIISLYLYLGV